MNRIVCVMVTGVGGGGIGQQIIKALRLANTNYEIIGTDITPLSKGLMEVDYPYIIPKASENNYIACLIALIKKHNVKVLFPGSEPELKIISKERKAFNDIGVFLPLNPPKVIDICLNKFYTNSFLRENGFYYPHTVVISSINDLEKIDFYPVVLKPNTGGSGSTNVFIVQNSDELILLSKYILTIYPSFIAQEYIGTTDNEFTVGILISMDGELINSIAVKRMIMSGLSNKIKVKNRTKNKKLGKYLAVSTGITQGEIGRFSEITRQCENIALKMGCRSTVNIQCRFVDGKVYVFEINPRFSGTTSFRAMVGYNEPDILIKKYISGEKIEKHFDYGSGIIMRGLEEKLIDNIIIGNSTDLI
ncbi:ATP-grasp domain-containing protein [bacterium]|nr:ATP-grasp domain-containing protein [bacterium]